VAALSQVVSAFVFRLTFGLAIAMIGPAAGRVPSVYFRVNLWVLLGLNTLGALAARATSGALEPLGGGPVPFAGAVTLAAASYAGSVTWLCDRRIVGRRMLIGIAGLGFVAAIASLPAARGASPIMLAAAVIDTGSSGVLMGTTLGAMLLGHSYLNAPGLAPSHLVRAIGFVMIAAAARGASGAAGLVLALVHGLRAEGLFWGFLAFRWLTGVLAVAGMALLARQSMRIPNAQSATGILYAGVVFAFLGELLAQLLSIDSPFPL